MMTIYLLLPLEIKANWVFIFPQNPWKVIPPVGPIASARGDAGEFKARLSWHWRLRACSSRPQKPAPYATCFPEASSRKMGS